MALMAEWYNGYRFAGNTDTDLYNTDMVLYYLDESIPNRGVPEYLIDTNVRIDYGKLRHLLVAAGSSTATSTCCGKSSVRGRKTCCAFSRASR